MQCQTADGKSSSASSVVDEQEAPSAKETAETSASLFEYNGEEAGEKQEVVLEENGSDGSTFSYERLRAKSSNPVSGIDYKKREVSPVTIFIISWFICQPLHIKRKR